MNVPSIPQFECYEHSTSITRRAGNPFVDVRLRVTLEHAGRAYTIDGFYDGEQDGKWVYRFRFAPMYAGRWSFRIDSNIAELDGVRGELDAVDPISHGGLVTSSQFPNWLFRQDGTPELIINDGWTPHPGSSYGTEKLGAQIFAYPSEGQYKTFIDVVSRYGVNMIIELRQLYARQNANTDPSFLWPWESVDPARCLIDRDRFNLAYFQRLDRQIDHAKLRGVFCAIELLSDNSTFRRAEWGHHPWNEKNGGWLEDWDGEADDYTRNQLPFGWGVRRIFDVNDEVHVGYLKRYLSYVVARISAYWNVLYALGCESSNIYPGDAERVDRWYTFWGDYLASVDPHGRLSTLGDVAAHDSSAWHVLTGNTAFVFENARNNFIVSQEHSRTDDLVAFCDAINRFGERFWRFRKPVLIGEQDGRNNQKYDKERRAYWTAFASGYMMGRVDRHFAIADGNRLRESTLFGLDADPPIYHALRNLRSFVTQTGVSFWRMHPGDGLLIGSPAGVYCLAEEEACYLLYFAVGGTAGLDLPSGGFTARWYDPRNGTFQEARPRAGEPSSGIPRERSSEALAEGVETTSRCAFTAPDDNDWVLLITCHGNGSAGRS